MGQASRKIVLLSGLLLFGCTAAVFWPARGNGFVNWDDHSYVISQPGVLGGTSRTGLRWATTAVVAGNWHPLTLLSLQFDAQLFGKEPFGFHQTAVWLHALNGVLVFVALGSLTGCMGRSAAVAGLFALHPMRVESVAWISERKDVLSGFFFFMTLIAYAGYARAPSMGRYFFVVLAFALGLLSKSMLVTAPCVLLLLDYWPLKRTRHLGSEGGPTWLWLVAEKVPLLALSLVVSVVTIICQESALNATEHLPTVSRIENASTSIVAYLRQTVWPTGLSPYYGMQNVSLLQSGGAAVLVVAIAGVAIWQRVRRPWFLVGWLWFLGMLVPVLGLIHVGTQARADRYLYLPQIGLFLVLVWGAAEFTERSRWRSVAAALALFGYLLTCSVLTIHQITVWRDTESLWRRAYALDPHEALVIQPNLIRCLIYQGKADEALRLTRVSIRTVESSSRPMVKPSRASVWLAVLLAIQGEHAECIDALKGAIQDEPGNAELYSYRGKEFAALGKWEAAAEDFLQASTLSPSKPSYRFYLAHALEKLGRAAEATENYRFALRGAPKWPDEALSEAWRKSTSPDKMERLDVWPICLAEQAIAAVGQDDPQSKDVLAATFANCGRFDEARVTAARAMELAEALGQSERASAIGYRLALYERNQPFRQGGAEWNPIP